MEHAEVEKYIEVCFEILSRNKLHKVSVFGIILARMWENTDQNNSE